MLLVTGNKHNENVCACRLEQSHTYHSSYKKQLVDSEGGEACKAAGEAKVMFCTTDMLVYTC